MRAESGNEEMKFKIKNIFFFMKSLPLFKGPCVNKLERKHCKIPVNNCRKPPFERKKKTVQCSINERDYKYI